MKRHPDRERYVSLGWIKPGPTPDELDKMGFHHAAAAIRRQPKQGN